MKDILRIIILLCN